MIEKSQEHTEKFVKLKNVFNLVKTVIMNLEIGIRQSAAKFLNLKKYGKGSETRW